MATAREALAFVGLPPHPAVEAAAAAVATSAVATATIVAIAGQESAQQQPHHRRPQPQQPAQRGEASALADFYEPFNAELTHLTDGDARFKWRGAAIND